MFSILFGWHKASKCKKMIKRARRRLRELKSKRKAIATHLRNDLAELIQNSHQEIAIINRVEQLIQDENLVAAYEMLDHFFEFILKRLSYIRRHKDCPSDINEAISSVIFASSRCGNFPELYVIKNLFRRRYGEEFATAAVELLPGNLVNNKLKECLLVKQVPNDLKYRVVDEIAKDNNCLQLQVNGCKRNQLVESGVVQVNETMAGSEIYSSQVKKIEDVTCVTPSILEPIDSYSLPQSPSTDTLELVSSVQQYPEPNFSETSDLQNKGEIMAFSPYAEAKVEYVGDIEESEFFVSKYCSCHDQRLLLLDCDENDTDRDEPFNENLSLGKSKRPPKKRLRRSNLNKCECSLDYPCYCCVYNDQEYLEALTILKPEKETGATEIQQGVLHFLGELFHCNPRNSGSITRTETDSRALIVSSKCSKNCNEIILRTGSSSSQQPKHVHPKLPEYDDIVAFFTAIKRENVSKQQKKVEQE